MNLQEALDQWPDHDEPTPVMEHLVLAAAQSVADGTFTDTNAHCANHMQPIRKCLNFCRVVDDEGGGLSEDPAEWLASLGQDDD